jgi:hypothetical protein
MNIKHLEHLLGLADEVDTHRAPKVRHVLPPSR